MALDIQVGQLIEPGSTGNQSYTGLGFQPKVVLFFAQQVSNGPDAADDTNGFTVGVGISSTERGSTSNWSLNTGSTASCGSRDQDNRCLAGVSNTGLALNYVDFVSNDADGFTINWTNRHTTFLLQGFWIALGGADIDQLDFNWYNAPASTGNNSVTGLGFKPDLLFLFGSDIQTDPFAGQNSDAMGWYGWAHSSGEFAVSQANEQGANPSDTYRRAKSGVCLASLENNGTLIAEASLASFDSDGFTLNWLTTLSGLNYAVLAIKGGGYHVDSFTQATSTGNQTITGVGFQPEGIFFGGADTTATTIQAGSSCVYGASDGTDDMCWWSGQDDNVNPVFGTSYFSTSKCIQSRDVSNTNLRADASISTFNSDGFTLNWANADATARNIFYVAFDDNTALPEQLASNTIALTQTADEIADFNLSASNTIVLTSVAESNEVFATAANTVSLTQTATVDILESEYTASNTITLTQTAEEAGPIPVTATNTLSLAQTATAELFPALFASNTLSLTQLAEASGPISVSASSLISLVQFTDFAEDIFLDASSTLTLNQTAVSIGPIEVDASNTITLTSVSDTTIKFRAIEQEISLAQTAINTISKLAKNELALTQVAERVLFSGATSQLIDLVQTVEIPNQAENDLELTQTLEVVRPSVGDDYFSHSFLDLSSVATLTQDRSDSASNSIALSQSLAYTLVADTTVCDYAPFIGSTEDPDAPSPPSATLPAADTGMTSGIKFEYPPTSPTETILINSSMNLGDINRLSFDRIIRESRGGTLFVFADPNWPKSESLLFTVSNLKESEATAIKNFVELTAGRQIRLTTHEGRIWDGYITNPSEVVVQDRRDSYTVTVEFEGSEV